MGLKSKTKKKDTAMDWFFDKIKSHFEHDGDLFEGMVIAYAIAKQKERAVIKEAWEEGSLNTIKRSTKTFEEYYKENYEL